MRRLLVALCLAATFGCVEGEEKAESDYALRSLRLVRIGQTQVCLVVVSTAQATAMQALPCEAFEGLQVMVVRP